MRLKYAGLRSTGSRCAPTWTRRSTRLAAAGGSSYLLATYTAMLDLRRRLEQRGLVLPFWQEAA